MGEIIRLDSESQYIFLDLLFPDLKTQVKFVSAADTALNTRALASTLLEELPSSHVESPQTFTFPRYVQHKDSIGGNDEERIMSPSVISASTSHSQRFDDNPIIYCDDAGNNIAPLVGVVFLKGTHQRPHLFPYSSGYKCPSYATCTADTGSALNVMNPTLHVLFHKSLRSNLPSFYLTFTLSGLNVSLDYVIVSADNVTHEMRDQIRREMNGHHILRHKSINDALKKYA
jgi:hypothetical protein